MSTENENPLFTGPAASLLRAAGVGSDFTGSARIVYQIASCINAAAAVWPTDALMAWRAITNEMVRTLIITKSQATQSSLKLFLTPETLSEQHRQLLAYRAPGAGEKQGNEAHSLLGKALVVAASAQHVLPTDFLKGIKTLGLARQDKGRRSSDWNYLIGLDLTDNQALSSITRRLPEKSPAAGFARFSSAVLSALVIAPVFREQQVDSNSYIPQQAAEANEVLRVKSTKVATPKMAPGAGEGDGEILPDISTRFAAAEFASFSAKLGLPHRDHLLVDDLKFVTRQFSELISTGTPEQGGFAVLATLSLVTGWSDKAALKLTFCPGSNNWLDLEKGAWVWDFQEYRKSIGRPSTVDAPEPTYCPWPKFLNNPLQKALGASPGAKALGDLIQVIQGVVQFDIEKYRKFLRSCGHPAHPPYPARFAHSLYPAYLEITGSDMTSTLMTGFCAGTAPSAPSYFGPLYATLIARATVVYERLGLGPPSDLFNLSGRSGCKKVLETEDLQIGWAKLIIKIKEVRKLANDAPSYEEKRQHCNRWMILVGTAFIVQTGHRGTRLDCLTVGALHVHPDVVLINDKDERGRAQPRLVPKTLAVRELLQCAAECRQKMELKVGCEVPANCGLSLDELVFVQWSGCSEASSKTCLSAEMVSETTTEFFGSTANFGRSNWVTYLDQSGSDRWLNRSLTGHTRDITRTHGAYLDIPPLTMAKRLCVEMEKTGIEIFGQTDIGVLSQCQLQLTPPLLRPRLAKFVKDGPVPDPCTILAPLSVSTLTDWKLVEQIRKDLYTGRIDAPIVALAVLHLMFIDQVPDGQVCVDVVSGTNGSVKQYGQRKGVIWNRPHFVHPAWFPIQAATGLLLDLLPGPPSPAADIIGHVCRAVRNGGYGSWPSNDAVCFEIIANLGVSYRRLSFPPSLSAVSDLAVPAPCLSPQSLHRLSGGEVPPLPPQLTFRAHSSRTACRLEDWRFLVSTLNKYSSKVQRHGERQARAVKCLADLQNSTIFWTPFPEWLRDWCVDELQRSRAGLDGCFQISTISTYLSALGRANDNIDIGDEPADWDDADWSRWVMAVNCKNSPTSEPLPCSESPNLNEWSKHALHALVASLIRRNQFVPLEVRIQLGFQSKKAVCRNSASSTLISKADLAKATDILKDWHKDFPADFLLVDFRATVSAMVPCRAGDISSLKAMCLTLGDGLIFERAGYDVHKSPSAIRLVPLNNCDALKLKQKMLRLDEHLGIRPLVVRGNGSDTAALRDQRLTNDFGLALKKSTGDLKARPHSVRATSLQEATWPGWQEQAGELLQAIATSKSCHDWVTETAEFPLRLSRSVSIAGQSDLRSALGNYLAAWPLIYSIHCTASLLELIPNAAFLSQLGLSPANFRKARSRQSALATDFADTPTPTLDAKAWIELQATKQNKSKPPKAVTTDLATREQIEPIDFDVRSSVSDVVQLNYLAVRTLGLCQEHAMERIAIPHTLAVWLDAHSPADELVAVATSRGRKGSEARGKAGDIDMALSSVGREALAWLCKLSDDNLSALQSLAFRTESIIPSMFQKVEFFENLAKFVPATFSIGIRFGARHLDIREKSGLASLAPTITFSKDARLGQRPEVLISLTEKSNTVVTARLTSVVRVQVIVLQAYRARLKGGEHA